MEGNAYPFGSTRASNGEHVILYGMGLCAQVYHGSATFLGSMLIVCIEFAVARDKLMILSVSFLKSSQTHEPSVLRSSYDCPPSPIIIWIPWMDGSNGILA